MNCPIRIDTSMDLSILHLKGLHVQISIKLCISFPKDFLSANSVDPDDMPPDMAFHLGLHCLPKYLFISIQNEKVHLYTLNVCCYFHVK